MLNVIWLSETSESNPVPPVKVKVSDVLYWSGSPASAAKVINWLTVPNDKLPEPSVFKNCPTRPSAPGKTNVLDVVIAFGAFNPIYSVPLFVPSLNLISPPVDNALPTFSVLIAKLASTKIAELAVNVPSTWSNFWVKYLPPITSSKRASPVPTSIPPVPIKSLSPALPCVPVPYVYANSPSLSEDGAVY